MQTKTLRSNYKNFEKNLPEIIKPSKENEAQLDSFDNLLLKNPSKFIPFVKERDGVGRLLSTENSICNSNSVHRTKTNMQTSESQTIGKKNFHLVDKFRQTLDKVLNYNDEFIKKRIPVNKKSPCFLSPTRQQYVKAKESSIPALGIFYLSQTNIVDEAHNIKFTETREKNKVEENRSAELTDPEIVNLANKKRILNIPDFNKQLGRVNESPQKHRMKNTEEDMKNIEKKIEFHKYLTKKYGSKIRVAPFMVLNTKHLPINYEQIMQKREKI